MTTKEYPDSEAVAIVSSASKASGKSVDEILEDFGEFIVPDLVNVYGSLIKSEWKTLDLIEHTETVIHTTIRRRNPEAKPPHLKCIRLNPNEVQVQYQSARKMCGVAKGISKGVTKHFHERVMISEPTCMSKGAKFCNILVKLV